MIDNSWRLSSLVLLAFYIKDTNLFASSIGAVAPVRSERTSEKRNKPEVGAKHERPSDKTNSTAEAVL